MHLPFSHSAGGEAEKGVLWGHGHDLASGVVGQLLQLILDILGVKVMAEPCHHQLNLTIKGL